MKDTVWKVQVEFILRCSTLTFILLPSLTRLNSSESGPARQKDKDEH